MIAASSARSSPYPVSIRQAVPGLADWISRHTSTPSPSGSRTSRTATSTPSTGTRFTADSAVAASPTTSMSGSAASRSFSPIRTTSWSSTTNTLMVFRAPPACAPAMPCIYTPFAASPQLAPAGQAQLAEQGTHLTLGGLHRLVQPLRDLPVGEPVPDQFQHLPVPPGQAGPGAQSLAQHVHGRLGRTGIQGGPARRHVTDRHHQLFREVLLAHVAGRAGHDRPDQRLVTGVPGEHQAGRFRDRRPDLTAYRHAVTVGELHVQHGHVRLERPHQGERGPRRRGLAHHLDVGLPGKAVPQGLTDQGMIIYKTDPDSVSSGAVRHAPPPVRIAACGLLARLRRPPFSTYSN